MTSVKVYNRQQIEMKQETSIHRHIYKRWIDGVITKTKSSTHQDLHLYLIKITKVHMKQHKALDEDFELVMIDTGDVGDVVKVVCDKNEQYFIEPVDAPINDIHVVEKTHR